MLLALTACFILPQFAQEFYGESVGFKLTKTGGELIETVLAKDRQGKWVPVLTTPSNPGIGITQNDLTPSAASVMTGGGIFKSPPTMRFAVCDIVKTPSGATFTLTNTAPGMKFVKTVKVPGNGQIIEVDVQTTFGGQRPLLEYLMMSYAFTPEGKRMSQGGKPDSTFSPGLRPREGQVVGDHFFRAPVISAQTGKVAALMLPDVETLADNRPMPTILDLDANNGVVDAPLMSYGFCDHRPSGHVYYTHDASMVRRVPNELNLDMDLIVSADAPEKAAYTWANSYWWKKVGKGYFDQIFPQAMPFEEYAKVCYPAAFAEKQGNNQLGWFEVEIDGKPCGGVMAGWGYQQGWVSWQPWFNNLRSAWGMRWWGKKLGNQDWVDKADKMLNLALAAPMDQGAVPTTYMSREKQWKGCLIMPRQDCYYDLTNMAWKGIWMLKWAEWQDCPRRAEVLQQCRQMAFYMVNHQNTDGSFPSWLTKDHKVVPILDHSAQSALPAWFLAELYRFERDLASQVGGGSAPSPEMYKLGARKAADFLIGEVIDGQYYYDFETFFSCSPKECFQVNGSADHEKMRDHHTLSAPQNTLCMHWAAEALRLVSNQTGDQKYMPYAMKALHIMTLYQNVWPISYRNVAYTFGGFGVQNSDGEYNDARQAQFGTTLCDFGVQLGDQELFERGVAATRAAMTLINHPLHVKYGLYPNPNYPLGLQPENNGHGGTDQQNGRTGFDWGEGSGLTSMAYLLDKYGSSYRHQGWSVLVDGGSKGVEMAEARPKQTLTNPTFDFADWRMKGWSIRGDFAEVPTYSTRMDFGVNGRPFIGTCEDGKGGFEDRYTGVITSPEFKVTRRAIRLLVGGGSGRGVSVELLRADTGAVVYTERGHNRERMDERVWDVSSLQNVPLQIRINDGETGGWGHINVGDVRVVDR